MDLLVYMDRGALRLVSLKTALDLCQPIAEYANIDGSLSCSPHRAIVLCWASCWMLGAAVRCPALELSSLQLCYRRTRSTADRHCVDLCCTTAVQGICRVVYLAAAFTDTAIMAAIGAQQVPRHTGPIKALQYFSPGDVCIPGGVSFVREATSKCVIFSCRRRRNNAR